MHAGLSWLYFHLLISRHACSGQSISVLKVGSLCRRPPNDDGPASALHCGSLFPLSIPNFLLASLQLHGWGLPVTVPVVKPCPGAFLRSSTLLFPPSPAARLL